jgi:signal transduction histidine kinase
VEVTAASAAGSVVLTVDDDGTGMTEEERGRAADRLWRSPRVQNIPGTGLGLSIVARAVEESGGALILEDSPAGGLRVVLRLVRADASLT